MEDLGLGHLNLVPARDLDWRLNPDIDPTRGGGTNSRIAMRTTLT